MERRTFLKSSIATTIGVSGFGSILLHASDQSLDEDLALPRYDLIICGGTFAGCLCAIQAAEKGLKVLVIEERTYLGAEITAKFRPWLKKDGFNKLSPELKELILPEEEQSELGFSIPSDGSNSLFNNETPLFCGAVKKQLMRALMENNVHVLLMTGSWGIVGDKDRQTASGLVLASKYGLQIVRGSNILDARIPGSESTEAHSFVLEFHDVDNKVKSKLALPEKLGINRNSILLHKGKRKPGQYFIEFTFTENAAHAENKARLIAEELSAYLIAENKAFSKASLVHTAYETSQQVKISNKEQEQSFLNVHRLDFVKSQLSSCRDLTDMNALADQVIGKLSPQASKFKQEDFIHYSNGEIPIKDCQISPIDDIKLHHAIQNIRFSANDFIPVKLETDLLVAGGGTAGAMVSKAALERGVNVTTVEYFPDLGGTKTLGGVIGYYWGYPEAESFIKDENERSVLRSKLGKGSAIPAFMMHLRKNVLQNKGQLLTNSIICDALMEGSTVKGLLVYHEGQLHILKSSLTIDATGDGDVAVFSGASFDYGDAKMNCTQNYSQWDFKTGLVQWADSTESRDYDIIQNQYLSELQRGYQLSHSQAKYYDFSSMLTVRESRRIHGEYTLTLKDIVEDRHHKDVLCVSKSDYDPHHFGDNIYTRVGCLVPHGYEALVEIPYRSLIPKGINNLLVSAKAISQSQIALQFTRMSLDILNLGYATGIVAAAIIQQGADMRDFKVERIQDELTSLKIVPPERMGLPIDMDYSEAKLNQQITELKKGQKNSLFKVLFIPKEKVLPLLKSAFKEEGDDAKKTNIARALAWFGCGDGNSLLLKEMRELVDQEVAEHFQPKEYYRVDSNSNYWKVNQDIILLALSGERSVLPDILAVSGKMNLNNPPVQQHLVYERGRIDLALIPFYNRILNICYAVELMPEDQAKTQLNRFLDDLYLKEKQTVSNPLDAGKNLYGAILESRVAITLASLGEKRGFRILVKYLADVHTVIASYAHGGLCDLSKNDFGFDQERWNLYIDSRFRS